MTQPHDIPAWCIFRGTGKPDGDIMRLPDPPSWRAFKDNPQEWKGTKFKANRDVVEMVNAALYLRRPLLVTGKPGMGKSSIAYAIAHELRLDNVLKWTITTRTTLKDGLYSYDAIGRLQEAQRRREEAQRRIAEGAVLPAASAASTPTSTSVEQADDIGDYITLGALGTAFTPRADGSKKPRVLLIDEIDKSDIDLPNDLLNLFEEGEFSIPELQRIKTIRGMTVRTADRKNDEVLTTVIRNGYVRCRTFPLVIMTSNDERDFPPPFLRRCLRLEMPVPKIEELTEIVMAHLAEDVKGENDEKVKALIEEFVELRDKGLLATDQLLNAIYFMTRESAPKGKDWDSVKKNMLKYLDKS
jgi:MoxR-like ATPase